MRIELTTSYKGHTLETYVDVDGKEVVTGIIVDLFDERELLDEVRKLKAGLIPNYGSR